MEVSERWELSSADTLQAVVPFIHAPEFHLPNTCLAGWLLNRLRGCMRACVERSIAALSSQDPGDRLNLLTCSIVCACYLHIA